MAETSLIEASKGYKTILMRMSTDTTEADNRRYVLTEGRTKAAIAKEKASLKAQGFSVLVWTPSTALFKKWRNECDKDLNNPGLPEAALEMLRTQFGIHC